MIRWLVGIALVAACSKSEPPPTDPPSLIPAEELKRGTDACQGYVDKVCACADQVEAAKEECTLARALPQAIEISQRFAASPKANREDAEQAASSIRKTVKQCIERTAKLPALGCPP